MNLKYAVLLSGFVAALEQSPPAPGSITVQVGGQSSQLPKWFCPTAVRSTSRKRI
ncbi:MAG TPA: hypothetical protein VEV17_09465 [Bryobacteraceae bacterium]|nr:hypothetical protein [Bryobacteraceae bacterium]